MDYYTRQDAERAVRCAEEVVEFVRDKSFKD